MSRYCSLLLGLMIVNVFLQKPGRRSCCASFQNSSPLVNKILTSTICFFSSYKITFSSWIISGPFVDINYVYFWYTYTVTKTRYVSCILAFILFEDLMDFYCYSKWGGCLKGDPYSWKILALLLSIRESLSIFLSFQLHLSLSILPFHVANLRISLDMKTFENVFVLAKKIFTSISGCLLVVYCLYLELVCLF